MKTLKFMLAAATAIGLASAYADPEAGASTTFETLTQGTNVVNGLRDTVDASGSYFYYAGDPADNESTIVAAGDMSGVDRPRGATGSRNNILQVSTGTNALFRTFNSFTTTPVTGDDLNFTNPVYVDTLVQFTVTPVSDTVTPSDSDKLMIYFKEWTNVVQGATEYHTNLFVVGGFFNGADTVAHEYRLSTGNVEVHPNEWHRLTVKALGDISGGSGFPGFQIKVDGELCQLVDEVTYDLINAAGTFDEFDDIEALDAGYYVLSILAGGGSQPAQLQAVGFAGEGKVDDLMITTADPFVDPVQFTLTLGTGVSAVEFTIGAATYSTAENHQYSVYPDDVITVTTVTYATGYAAAANTATGLTGDGPYTVGNTACSLVLNAAYATYNIVYELGGGTAGSVYEVSYTYSANSQTKTVADPTCEGSNFVSWTISPNTVTISGTTLTIPGGTTGGITLTANWEAAQSGWDPNPGSIPANNTVADQYPALANSVLATANAKQVTEWAAAKNVNFADVEAATSGTTYSDAFLLNCAPTAEAVAEEKEEFVLEISVAADGTVTVSLPAGKSYNGTIQMKGSPDLTTWTNVSETSSTYKFYKYELSL